MPRGHGSIATRLQVSQVAQCTDDAPTDFLDYGRNSGIGGGLDLQARLHQAARRTLRQVGMPHHLSLRQRLHGGAQRRHGGRRPRIHAVPDFRPWRLERRCGASLMVYSIQSAQRWMLRSPHGPRALISKYRRD